MNPITLLSFLIFTALVGIITYYRTRRDETKSKDGYFLGGRSLTGGVIGGSLLLTNLNANNFVGMNAQAYTHNMSVMGWEVGSGIALVIVALFLLPRYLKAGITTVPDFLESRFDKGVKSFVTYLFLIGYVVNVLPPCLYSGAIAMSALFNVSETLGISHTGGIWITVWAIGIIGSLYAIFGGLKAVAISDTLNGIGLVIASFLVPILGLIALGDGSFSAGLSIITTEAPEKLNAVGSASDPVPFLTLFTGIILVNLYYWGTDQAIIQRALGAKNLVEGQKGVMLAGFLKVLTPFIVCFPGVIAYHMYGADKFENADMVYPALVNDIMPTALIGLFAAVMFGAILSTFNSVLNSAATLFTLNVYKPLLGKGKSDEEIVSKGKIYGGILAVISMCIAPFIMYAPQGLFQYLQIVNGFFNVPIFTIIFMGYVTKNVPAIAAKIALAAFVFTYALLQLVIKPEMHFLHQLALLFVASCLLMLLIGVFKKRDTPYALTNRNLVNIDSWKYSAEASIIIIATMASVYLLFWPSHSRGPLSVSLPIVAAASAAAIAGIAFYRKRRKAT